MLLLIISYLLPISALGLMFWLLITGDIRKQQDARSFRIFLFNLILWLCLLFAADYLNKPSSSLIFLRFALSAGSFAPVVFYIFCQRFVDAANKFFTKLFLLTALFFATASLTNLMVVRIQSGTTGIQITQATSLYFFQTLYTVIAFGLSFAWLHLKTRNLGDIRIKDQIHLITVGAVTALAIGIIGATVNTGGSNLLSPLAVTVFAASSFFAIFRQGLFDIRLVVARSIAYLLSLSLITAIFSLLIFGFAGAVLESNYSRTTQQIFYVLVTLLLVLSYNPLQNFFNRLTNRVFYRDAYNPQVLLDELNAGLVTTIELKQLLELSSRIISKHLKIAYCSFGIHSKGTAALSSSLRIFGTKQFIIPKNEQDTIFRASDHLKGKVLVASELEPAHRRLIETLHNNSIMALSRLATHSGNAGYIFLGDKKSGNLYTKQDAQIIEIISDELAIAIQNALRFEEIQQFNITLQQKIEEATKELKKVNSRLRELDKTKDEFISMASHQLRTPLTTVKGYLSMILDGDTGPVKKQQKELVKHAFDGANKMVYLIADLLNVSRLQTGKFVIDNHPTNLAEAVEGEIVQLNEQAANREIKLTYHKPESFPVLSLDETKIRQVIMNFLDNALYYTPRGGSVIVELVATDKEVSYTVTDTGMGVPKEVQHHLFAKFYWADNAKKMRPDGTGLGLYMAKKVVAAQGGAIIFRSTEGKGSTFGFSFPRKTTEIKAKA